MLVEIAWAKVNLALHVRRRRDDGYHDIETLFAFATSGDRLTAAPASSLELTVRGPFAAALEGAGADNLVLRAARALAATRGVSAGAALSLDKRLPVAAGIGGGSADAAAALRLLSRLWRVAVPEGLAASLGADVSACLGSRTARGVARGDTLVPISAMLAKMPVLLVNPRIEVSTAAVFAGWDGVDRGSLAEGDPLMAARGGRNDLVPAAIEVAPVIADVLAVLEAMPGAVLVRMSGSGATCFALFDEIAMRDQADVAVGAAHPEWWRLSTRVR